MTTSTLKDPIFTYADSGTYDVSLKVTLPSGKNVTVHQMIDVFLLSDVSYDYDIDCDTVTFTDTSIAPNIVSWHWEFDDGTESFDQNPVHVFPFAFNYGVSLTVHTLNGGIGFTEQNVVVTGGTFTADFTTSITGDNVDFTDTTTADCGETSWLWVFGDGIGTSTDQNPSYTYLADGTYTVSFTAYGALGLSDTITHDVVIDNTWCYTFDFTANNGSFTNDSTADGGAAPPASYVSGQGWQVSGVGTRFVRIYRNFSGMANVNRMDMVYTVTGDNAHATERQLLGTKSSTYSSSFGGLTESHTTDLANPSSAVSFGHDFSDASMKAIIAQTGCNVTAGIPITTTITSLTIQGSGTNPFGSDNC